MVPSKFVRRSLVSGVKLGDVEKKRPFIFAVLAPPPGCFVKGGGDPGEGSPRCARGRCFLALDFCPCSKVWPRRLHAQQLNSFLFT